MKVKWRFGTPARTEKISQHLRQPTKQQIENYNRTLQTIPFTWDTIQTDISRIALETRGEQPGRIRKPYIRTETQQILAQQDQAIQEGNTERSRLLTNLFRRRVKRDKKDFVTDQLRTFVGAQKNWKAIKQLRSKFTPRYSKRGNDTGSHPANYPEECAQYFANTHWKATPPKDTAHPRPLYPQTPNEGRFTLEELNGAIDNLERNKAGGPDQLITELFKDMDPGNRD